jgi:hypothetical protein
MALFLLERGADPNAGDAGLTPLHWAAGTWEGGVSNPVYGFSDAMSGIPDRQAKLRICARADGARRGRERSHGEAAGIRRGLRRCAGATPFLLASSAADVEMMRILLAAVPTRG